MNIAISDIKIDILRKFFENELRKCISYLRIITILKPFILIVFISYLVFCLLVMFRVVFNYSDGTNVDEILSITLTLLAIIFVLFFAESKISHCKSIFDLVIVELDEELEKGTSGEVAKAFRGKLDYLDCRSRAVEEVLKQVFKVN